MSEASAALLIGLAIRRKKNKKRNRELWAKEWYRKRNDYGHSKLLKELENTSINDYNNFLRMSKPNYMELLEKVEPFIIKETTIMRKPISPNERLSLTLRFLATGETFEELKFLTAIAPQTIGKIVMETCEAIITVLKDSIKVSKKFISFIFLIQIYIIYMVLF